MAAAKRSPAFGSAGKRLIAAITGEYGLDVHEQALLEQAARCLDIQAELQRQIDKDSAVIAVDFEGPRKPHPALAELRAQQGIYIRLLRQLGLPKGVAAESGSRATKFNMKLRGLPGLA